MFTRASFRWLAALPALAALCATMVLTAGAASAGTVTGVAKAPNGLTIRNGPGAGFNAVGTMAYNQSATVVCYAFGSDVNGDPYWDSLQVSSGHPVYVSDYWLDTGGNITGQVPSCESLFSAETPGIAKEPGGLPAYQNPGADPLGVSLTYGNTYTVVCYNTGPSVNGDSLWDNVVVSIGGGVVNFGYVADYWLYTGGDVTKQTVHC